MTMGAAGATAQAERPGPSLESVYRPAHALDLARVVMFQQRGVGDPTLLRDGPVIWRGSRTPEGAATVALRQDSSGAVRAAAWGPGAAWAMAQLPDLCGAADDPAAFEPGPHPVVREAVRHHVGLRLGRTDLLFDALAGAIIEQKVTGVQAFAAWRRLVCWHGDPAPGPTPMPMFVPPTIAGWRAIPSWSWHRAGLEPPQSRAIVESARRGGSLVASAERAGDGPGRDRVLTGVRGVGAWTAAETRIRAFGDTDAVSVGDYHLAHEVGYALTGHRVDDDGMLELLEPWAGQRQRVIRLIRLSGAREPRRGPRLHPEDHRAR
ncbi:MAG TPA: 3-methyladenine DNA glycosylase [Microbacterium sp.]|nr:3-methyladenine DNA glycosylase [Microbacterium sp.]